MRTLWTEKWNGMSWYQRGLLLAMAVMILGFGVATAVATCQRGLKYGGALLYPVQDGEIRQYSGKVKGKESLLTIRPGGVVEYRWGEHAYGPWQVEEDPTAVPGGLWVQGIQIRKGGEVVFRGGYADGDWHTLYDQEGKPMLEMAYTVSAGGETIFYVGSQEVDAVQWNEPSLHTVASWAMSPEPELTHRGSILLYLMVTLLALLNTAQICFPGAFFRWSIRWHVRDPEQAEPSEIYIALERIEWAVLAGACLFMYWQALTIL